MLRALSGSNVKSQSFKRTSKGVGLSTKGFPIKVINITYLKILNMQ